MIIRNLLRAVVSFTVIATSVVAFGAAAQAQPLVYLARAIHANGAGALGAQSQGGLSWSNRSVTLTASELFVKNGECAEFYAYAEQSGAYIDSYRYPTDGTCQRAYNSDVFQPIGNIVLDGSAVPGGINKVTIYAMDDTHKITGYAECPRSASSCTTGQFASAVAPAGLTWATAGR